MPVAIPATALDEVLAGVEDQKNSLVPQMGQQARRRVARLNRQPQHGGGRCGDEGRIAEHGEVDEEDGAGESLHQVMPDCDRRRGLADAAGADDGDEAGGGQLRRNS
jgi:hypothetical protein